MTSENWCMSVNDRVYGPYSTEKMAELAAQKRLAYHSMVAPAGSRDFRPALQFTELRPLFGGGGAPSREESGEPAKTHLILFGDSSLAAGKAGELLDEMPEARALTGTAYLVRSARTADEIRDRMAAVLPSTERAIVLTLSGATAASHGIALNEHEDIRALLAQG